MTSRDEIRQHLALLQAGRRHLAERFLAEAVLAPVGKVAKKYAIHCVGHAHIDMNWMWSWPESVATTNDTFLTVLKLMDEFPDFCFTQSQASVYALIRDYNPALLERIRRRAAEGRWEVAAVTYAMKAGQPWLDVAVQVRWLERGGPELGVPMLRMRLPLEIDAAKGRYEIPFGWIDRDLAAGEEVPALRWADVTGRVPGRQAAAGCALLNDSKYGHSLEESTLRLTLIRSTYDPDPLPEIGDHTIRMGLLPHGKAPPAADLVRLGAAFNHPLLVAATDVHAGTLPARGAAVSAGPANVVVSSVRQAQDDGGIIFHLYETAGKAAKAKVALDAALMGKAAEAVEVDLLERAVANSSARTTKDGFAVSAPARGIAAVKVTFAK
jgi:alpha-mannosidase